jgi:diadenosine tetraphosphatase ApaH/serine/threonine PP2A family protein phosphatase
VRYGVLGDVHSNLEALDAVLAALEKQHVDAVLCTGDLVGYGGSPRECVARVRELAPRVLVAGNHDWAAAGRLGLEYFNQYARDAILWTRSALSRDDLQYLGDRAVLSVDGDVTVAHGTVHDPELFDYLQTPYDAHLSFAHLTTPFAFVGHSHIPVTFLSGPSITYVVGEEIRLDAAAQALVNVGSVGQPRDEDPRASFGVFDADERVVRIHRVEYDVEAAIARIDAAGLPRFLGERLRIGR